MVGLCTQDYQCLSSRVTICAAIIARKFDFYILTTVTSKNRSNWGECVGAPTSDARAVQIC